MADQIMTQASELAVLSPEIWSQRFRDVNRATLPFIESVSRDWEGEIADEGDLVNISYLPDFDQANLLGEGEKGLTEAIQATQLQLIINSRPYKDFIVTKKASLQSIPFMDKMRDAAVYSIMKKIQALIIAAIVPSAATPDHQIGYDAGSTLALADILEAKELLLEANCPQDNLQMVLGSAQWMDLFNLAGFTSRDYVPVGSPLATGEFMAPIAGFAPKYTSVASSTAYFFHPSFLTMAIQQDLNIAVDSMSSQGIRATRISADILMGYKLLDDERVVTIS